MAWFVQLNGKVFGPLNNSQMVQLASAGKIATTTDVSQQRDGPWVPATRIKGLFDQGNAKASPTGDSVAQPQSLASTNSAPGTELPATDTSPSSPPIQTNPVHPPPHASGSGSRSTPETVGAESQLLLQSLESFQAAVAQAAMRQWVTLVAAAAAVFVAAITIAGLVLALRYDHQGLHDDMASVRQEIQDQVVAIRKEIHEQSELFRNQVAKGVDEVAMPLWEYRIESPSDVILKQRLDEYGREGWEVVEARRASDALRNFSYELIMKRRARR